MRHRFSTLVLVSAVALCAVLFAGPAPAAAETVKAGELVIFSAWARATAGRGSTGAAYVSIHNHGIHGDRLLGAASPAASRIGLHVSASEGGVMRMRRVDDIALAPGAITALEPGGMHLMLMGLNAPLKEGQRVPMTLRFQRAGEVAVTVEVMKVGAMGPAGKGQGEQHHAH